MKTATKRTAAATAPSKGVTAKAIAAVVKGAKAKVPQLPPTKRVSNVPAPKKGAVTTGMSVTIVALAAKHDVDPKAVRAKARRNRDKLIPHLFPATADDRWAFKPTSVKAVEAILFG